MKIEFDKVETVVTQNFKGGEGEFRMRVIDDGRTKFLRGTLLPGSFLGLHTHETNSETILVLSGTGKVLCDGVYEPLKPGDVHYCPMGHAHSLINDGEENLEVLGIIPEHGV